MSNPNVTIRDYFAAHASEDDINAHMWKHRQEKYIYTKPDGPKEERFRQAMFTREEAKYLYADKMLKARET